MGAGEGVSADEGGGRGHQAWYTCARGVKCGGAKGGVNAPSQYYTSQPPRTLSMRTCLSMPNYCTLNASAVQCVRDRRWVRARGDLRARDGLCA